MKYLVNRITKEHRVYTDGDWKSDCLPANDNLDDWAFVEADSEGWIPFANDGVCPLPDDCECNWLLRDEKEKRQNYCDNVQKAGGLLWDAESVVAYRPILTEQSEPEMPFGDKNLWIEESGQIEHSVFDRLASAVSASESIPALIAEINEMLPEGYMVAHIGVDMAKGADWTPEPAEDMSDWRNWREGDLLQCIRGGLGEPAFKLGGVYTIKFIMQSDPSAESMNRIGIVEDDVGSTNNAWQPRFFRWHSRPTGASK